MRALRLIIAVAFGAAFATAAVAQDKDAALKSLAVSAES